MPTCYLWPHSPAATAFCSLPPSMPDGRHVAPRLQCVVSVSKRCVRYFHIDFVLITIVVAGSFPWSLNFPHPPTSCPSSTCEYSNPWEYVWLTGAILILQTPQQPTYRLHVIPPSRDFHDTPNTPTIHLSMSRHHHLAVLTFRPRRVSTTPRQIITAITVITHFDYLLSAMSSQLLSMEPFDAS